MSAQILSMYFAFNELQKAGNYVLSQHISISIFKSRKMCKIYKKKKLNGIPNKQKLSRSWDFPNFFVFISFLFLGFANYLHTKWLKYGNIASFIRSVLFLSVCYDCTFFQLIAIISINRNDTKTKYEKKHPNPMIFMVLSAPTEKTVNAASECAMLYFKSICAKKISRRRQVERK